MGPIPIRLSDTAFSVKRRAGWCDGRLGQTCGGGLPIPARLPLPSPHLARGRQGGSCHQGRQREAVIFCSRESRADGLADTAQITRAVYPPYLRAVCLQMSSACRAASGGRRRLSFKQGASKADGLADTAQITRAVYPPYLRAACLQMPSACRAASGGRRRLSFKQDGSRGKILSLRTRSHQTYSEFFWWFCHSHGDTTVSPKRRIPVIILLSSCYHLAFIFKVVVCFCNVFLFCYVFLLLFIGVFLTKYH